MDGERLARQQAALAELGRRVAAPAELGLVLQDAVRLVAETLGAEHVSVMELSPQGTEVRLRAGVGWHADAIGHAVDAMPGGFVAYTMDAAEPVIVADLSCERRFAPSPLLLASGVRACLAVRIPGPAQHPFGVIGAHTARVDAFGPADAAFLLGVANVLSSAIARHRRAIEINDEILQTLVLAQYALRQGRADAGALLDRAIARTRGLVSSLLGSSAAPPAILPGDLRREAAVDVTPPED